MTVNQKLLLVSIMATSYIIGANIWFHNGWSQHDYAALCQQATVGIATLFGIDVYNKRRSQ